MLALRRQPMVWMALAALALVLVGRAAFAAANTVPDSQAGAGTSAVSGFTISAIDYNLNGTDPRNVDTVTYTATSDNAALTGTSLTIFTRFDSTGGVWYACTRSGGAVPAHNISCDTTAGTQLLVVDIDVLEPVIVQQ